ncbi:MAG: serine protease [Acidobacteriota bacterium]
MTDLVTLRDYFQLGRDRARNHLIAHAREHRSSLEGLEDAMAACVRVEISRPSRRGFRSVSSASGVLLEGGLVLTAGHAVHGQRDAELSIQLVDGRRLEARLRESEYLLNVSGRDWALLEVVQPPLDLASAKLGVVGLGDLVVVPGYPARHGVDPTGRVVLGDGIDILKPIPLVSRVSSVSPLSLEPVAGSLPLGGASGAPVFNMKGQLLGLFVGMSETRSEGVILRECMATGTTVVEAVMAESVRRIAQQDAR